MPNRLIAAVDRANVIIAVRPIALSVLPRALSTPLSILPKRLLLPVMTMFLRVDVSILISMCVGVFQGPLRWNPTLGPFGGALRPVGAAGSTAGAI